jgi:hypothetical protein
VGRFESELRDNEELHKLVCSLQRAADLVALSSPAQSLPPGLRDKVLQRIEAVEAGSEPAKKSLPPLRRNDSDASSIGLASLLMPSVTA